jgi:hypothetical protein
MEKELYKEHLFNRWDILEEAYACSLDILSDAKPKTHASGSADQGTYPPAFEW